MSMNPGEEAASRPGIVLAVDEPMTRASLRRLLEDAGFDVRAEAGDAETAIEVLRCALAGEAAIPRLLVAELVQDLQMQGRHRVIAGGRGRATLTGRQWEVLQLMCDGLSGRNIAERLKLSPVTIRRHSAEAVRKLGVQDRDEAIALLQENA
jgi:DNA-binding NarL/FixJ family response regulator